MTDINPFAPPEAILDQPTTGGGGGLEDAIAGRYQFGISEVMQEAWELTKGFKASTWGAMGVVWAGLIVLSMFNSFVLGRIFGSAAQMLSGIVLVVGIYPLAVGIVMMGVRRAAGLPVSFSTAFNYFDRTGSALLAGLLSIVFTYIGILALVIPGIYLSVAYYMTMPLLGDRELSAWRALETSRKAVTKRWFSVAGLFLLVSVVVFLSMLPLGIGLVWSLPWAVAVVGVLYKRMFGVASAA